MKNSSKNESHSISLLNNVFSSSDISMALTETGLVVEKTEKVAELYSKHLDWEKTKEGWHEKRLGERGSRGSSQKVFKNIKSRLLAGGDKLPSVKQLSELLDRCDNKREKSQLIYFYLVEDDPLVRYVVHEYANQMLSREKTQFDFGTESLDTILNEFRFDDGSPLDYSDSTLYRWGQGLRSVMREIGVLEGKQSVTGMPPSIGDIPLLVASGYSWKREGEKWIDSPTGFLYLFQPPDQHDSLINRLSIYDSWEVKDLPGKTVVEPVEDPFSLGNTG